MEFDLIERIRRRVATRGDVVLGIGDDAALLQVPAGMQLVVAMDTLNSGVHFPQETAPADIGWKPAHYLNNVSSSVAMARITSTSFIRRTGLKKWMPQKRRLKLSGITSDNLVIDKPDVFDANMAWSFKCGATLR